MDTHHITFDWILVRELQMSQMDKYCYIHVHVYTNILLTNFIFFRFLYFIISCFDYLLLLCIGRYSPFQLCKIKTIYCKWIERGHKYIVYVKSSNCTILIVSAVIYVIMLMYNLEINYLSIYLTSPSSQCP